MNRSRAFTAAAITLLAVGGLRAARDLRLLDAARQNDVRTVRALLKDHVDVNGSYPDGSTALAWAAYSDNLEMTALLIAAGADLNGANDYGETPLSIACQNRNVALVDTLLKAGANPNAATPGGETVLMTAADTGNVDVVKSLIASGADVDAKEAMKGQTALMWAVAGRHLPVVEALVAAGADIHAASKGGSTPLHFAVQQGAVSIVKLLLENGADPNATLTVRQIDQEIQPFVETLVNVTPLWIAITARNDEIGTLLLEGGANPNAGEYRNVSPLHFAVQARMVKLVRALLAAGADVNARVPLSALPLKGAEEALSGHRSFFLMPVGATPFLVAAQIHDPALMRVLLAAGADPHILADDKTTPVMAAAGMGDERFRPPGRRRPSADEAIEAVTIALEQAGEINAVNDSGQTALHGAASAHAGELIKLLMDRGARLDVKDKDGRTPLDIAEREQAVSASETERQRANSVVELLRKGRATKSGQNR